MIAVHSRKATKTMLAECIWAVLDESASKIAYLSVRCSDVSCLPGPHMLPCFDAKHYPSSLDLLPLNPPPPTSLTLLPPLQPELS